MGAPTVAGACVRKAWLTLDNLSVLLEDPSSGYFCTSLDLGTPDVRAVTAVLPDRDGTYDGTRYMGSRAVTAAISAILSAGARIDDVADSFGPFMRPSARPVLHYVLDRPGTPERVLTLRPVSYDYKIEGADQRDIALAWVAPDPIARNPTQSFAISWAGYGSAGRTYNRTYNWTYPAGSVAPTFAVVSSPGDVGIRPMLRIYGPITNPVVKWTYDDAALMVHSGQISFTPSSFAVPANHWLDIDCAAHTVLRDSDPTQSVIASVYWPTSSWAYIPPNVTAQFQLTGTGGSPVTQCQVLWSDGYFT